MSKFLRGLALGVIYIYQRLLSPLLGPRCRFHPSCSRYAEEALRRFGFWHGGLLALRRLARCHPLNAGGFDPLPEASPSPPCCDAHHG